MKILILILSLLITVTPYAQKNGKIFYQNIDSVNEIKKEFKKNGLNVEFFPKKIELKYFPQVQNVLYDYKSFFQKWYSQVDDVVFLDDESFSKLNKKNMINQDIEYVQKKYIDYQWDGEKYFTLPHIFSKIYFTAMVTEYSDKFILDIKIAEKLKN